MPVAIRILAIEDNPADYKLIQRALAGSEYDVTAQMVDTIGALGHALDQGDWDVVLLDYNVVGMDFHSSLRLAQSRLPNRPLILVSGSVSEEWAVEMIRQGVWDVVTKDRLGGLPAAIERGLREAALRRARQTASAELRVKEARLSLALAAAEMGVWEWNIASNQGYWSAQCAVILGRSLTGFGINQLLDMVHPTNGTRVEQQIAEVLTTGGAFKSEFRILTASGQARWITCHGRLHHDANGAPISLIGIMSDISARKRSEVALLHAGAVFAGALEGVLITERDGSILSANPAFCRLADTDQATLIGRQSPLMLADLRGPAALPVLMAAAPDSEGWQGELCLARPDGSTVPVLVHLSAMRDSGGEVTGLVGTCSDISPLKASQTALDFLAHHDPLTRLPNRLQLLTRLQTAIQRAQRERSIGAVLFLGVDRFKQINDGYGHSVGDAVLLTVAERCRARLREADLIARVGGDEFIVLLENLATADHAGQVARTLIDAVAQPLPLAGGSEVFLSISVGISVFPQDGATAERILRNADAALLQVKKHNRGEFRYAAENLVNAAAIQVSLDAALRRGLERHEFLLHYQPLVETRDGRRVGVEALLRWAPPDQQLILPSRFIALAEETGLIVPLGAWVLDNACRQVKNWRDAGLAVDVLAVNLSPLQFRHPDLLAMVSQTLDNIGFTPLNLEFEITEGALMDGAETESKLRALKALGVKLSIDDFGTGYSSLAYLKRFPIDKLKIDQSFVRDCADQRADMEIVAAVVSMAKSLRLAVLAEGVETEQQWNLLRALDCTYAQGYLFSHPVPFDLLPEQFLTPDQRVPPRLL